MAQTPTCNYKDDVTTIEPTMRNTRAVSNMEKKQDTCDLHLFHWKIFLTWMSTSNSWDYFLWVPLFASSTFPLIHAAVCYRLHWSALSATWEDCILLNFEKVCLHVKAETCLMMAKTTLFNGRITWINFIKRRSFCFLAQPHLLMWWRRFRGCPRFNLPVSF